MIRVLERVQILPVIDFWRAGLSNDQMILSTNFSKKRFWRSSFVPYMIFGRVRRKEKALFKAENVGTFLRFHWAELYYPRGWAIIEKQRSKAIECKGSRSVFCKLNCTSLLRNVLGQPVSDNADFLAKSFKYWKAFVKFTFLGQCFAREIIDFSQHSYLVRHSSHQFVYILIERLHEK